MRLPNKLWYITENTEGNLVNSDRNHQGTWEKIKSKKKVKNHLLQDKEYTNFFCLVRTGKKLKKKKGNVVDKLGSVIS